MAWVRSGNGYRDTDQHLDNEALWTPQCEWFIWASLLYYEYDLSLTTDTAFDYHCSVLLKNWEELPSWFTGRVSRDDLSAGTGFALVPSNTERWQAVEFYEKVKAPT